MSVCDRRTTGFRLQLIPLTPSSVWVMLNPVCNSVMTQTATCLLLRLQHVPTTRLQSQIDWVCRDDSGWMYLVMQPPSINPLDTTDDHGDFWSQRSEWRLQPLYTQEWFLEDLARAQMQSLFPLCISAVYRFCWLLELEGSEPSKSTEPICISAASQSLADCTTLN